MGTKDQEKDCSEAILRASHMEHILDPLDDGLNLKSPHWNLLNLLPPSTQQLNIWLHNNY